MDLSSSRRFVLSSSSHPDDSVANADSRLSIQVIDYLAKKGYTKTEAMLRMESANQQIDGRTLPQLGEDQRPKYRAGFGKSISPILHRVCSF
jgi:hypothetical protein